MNDYERTRFSRPTVVVIAVQAAVLAAVLFSAQPDPQPGPRAAGPAGNELALQRAP